MRSLQINHVNVELRTGKLTILAGHVVIPGNKIMKLHRLKEIKYMYRL